MIWVVMSLLMIVGIVIAVVPIMVVTVLHERELRAERTTETATVEQLSFGSDESLSLAS